MALEVFANDPTTTGGSWSTLASGYTSGATSLVITSNTKYAAADPTATPPTQFRVRIDNELFLVTDNRTTTWTVAGAQAGSTAANHASGATVTEILTKASLQAMQSPVSTGLYGAGIGALVRVPYVVGSQTGSFAWVSQRLYAIPTLITGPMVLTKLGFFIWSVNGSAGAVIRLGIYNDAGTGKPGSLLYDAGTVAATSGANGVITITLATPQTLAPGTYHIAAVLQGSPATVPQTLAASATGGFGGIVDPTAASNVIYAYQKDTVSGALPDPFGTPTNIAAGTNCPGLLIGA